MMKNSCWFWIKNVLHRLLCFCWVNQEWHSRLLALFTFIVVVGLGLYFKSGTNYIGLIEKGNPEFFFNKFIKNGSPLQPSWMHDDIPARFRLLTGSFIMLGTGVLSAAGFFWLLAKHLNFLMALFIFVFCSIYTSVDGVSDRWNSLKLNDFFIGIVSKAEDNSRIDLGIMGKKESATKNKTESCSKTENKKESHSTTENIKASYLRDQYINYTVIFMMIITFSSLCLRKGGRNGMTPILLFKENG